MEKILELAKPIQLLIFDVDGVLTNGQLYLTDENIEMKAFHSHDGMGIQLLLKSGVQVAIITARQSKTVLHRMRSLGVEHVYQGALHKFPAYEDLRDKLQLKDEAIAYMGDDLTDLAIMQRVGLSIAPANAMDFIKEKADFVTTKSGGFGAAREACDLIMQAQGTLESLYAEYL